MGEFMTRMEQAIEVNSQRLMAEAGLGLAFNAKPAERAQADLVVGPIDLAEVVALLP